MTYEQQLAAAYAERRRRMYAPRPEPLPANLPGIVPPPSDATKEAIRRRKIDSIIERVRAMKRDAGPTRVRLADIAAHVCAENGVTLQDLRSRRRSRRVVYVRQEFFYLARVMTEKSYPEIGRYTGHDHTTVIYGAKTHAERNGLPAPDDAEAADA